MQNNTITSDNALRDNKLPSQGYSNTMHDVAAVDPYQIAQQQRLMPREIKAGSQRGEMTIQGKLTVRNPNSDEQIIIGTVGNDFGLFGAANSNENPSIAWKIIGQTYYFYDLLTGKNIMQVGKLPDGTFNFASSKAAYNVSEAF